MQILTVDTETVWRNPVKASEEQMKQIEYTTEQKEAIRIFKEDFQRGNPGTYLLYGVTGSGKTEVYMEMIQSVVQSGRQAIVLIPEIALTYQTVMRFVRVFGNRVSIMNSRLSAGERYDQMMRAKNGEIDVMIGPRSVSYTHLDVYKRQVSGKDVYFWKISDRTELPEQDDRVPGQSKD